MRPAGEITQALLRAAKELAEQGRPATLVELAHAACVSREAARQAVPKLKSRGYLQQVGERRVDYRNRPVAEYAPAATCNNDEQVMTGFAVLDDCLQGWTR